MSSLLSPLYITDEKEEMKGRLALFFRIGRDTSLPKLYEYTKQCYSENVMDTFVLAFHLRDVRGGNSGGRGERKLGNKMLIHLFLNDPDRFSKIVHLIPTYGRWSDLLQFFPGVIDVDGNIEQEYSLFVENLDRQKIKEVQAMVVRLYGNQLFIDREMLGDNSSTSSISLAAKWAPSEGCRMDREYSLFKTLRKSMGLTAKQLRQQILTPLRKRLAIVETHACAREWSNIDYSCVPSAAMTRLRKTFQKHDPSRFGQWERMLRRGKERVSLPPHRIIQEVMNNHYNSRLEEMWKGIEERTKKSGVFDNATVVVDTSASMFQPDMIPFTVALALGLLISKNSRKFRNYVLTFSTTPEFVFIAEGTLIERYSQLRHIPWGSSINVTEVYTLILRKAIAQRLSDEDMPNTLYILSDNAVIDRAALRVVDERYRQAGYTRPRIVLWNLAEQLRHYPIHHDGTIIIPGFSNTILTALLAGTDCTPYGILRSVLDGERYHAVRNALLR